MSTEHVSPEDWAEYRELRMSQLERELDQLIDMHTRYGDSMQKTYLYRARNALKDGSSWFEWSRQRARKAGS